MMLRSERVDRAFVAQRLVARRCRTAIAAASHVHTRLASSLIRFGFSLLPCTTDKFHILLDALAALASCAESLGSFPC